MSHCLVQRYKHITEITKKLIQQHTASPLRLFLWQKLQKNAKNFRFKLEIKKLFLPLHR